MQDLWRRTLAVLCEDISPHSFDSWFTSLVPKRLSDDCFEILVPDQFHRDWISKNYRELIERRLAEQAQHTLRLVLDVALPTPLTADAHPPSEARQKGRSSQRAPSLGASGLNAAYSFQTFVVGGSNQFAHAAARAVADAPGQSYNPLFIYGGVGLGKTHLLHAIGNALVGKTPQPRLSYISSEYFVNDLISSLQHDRMNGFRDKYRQMDVLLIDDIHFLAGKDRTQEEFFHTFNTLHGDHKQIVISSDQYPKEIPAMEDRLRSRFGWGLIADIQPADLETKVAILHKKAEERSIDLPQDVALFIASKITTNIRELEGALVRISAFSSLTSSPISLQLAEETLQHLLSLKERLITIKAIQKAVCDHFNLNLADLKSKKRSHNISIPRQIAMFLCRQHTGASLPEIGRQFGGKDHSTVLHSYRKVEAQVAASAAVKNDLDQIRRVLELA
ncbi:MAG: chromosomal replication initiator protein DnaA [Candidatus Tectomicrobia bacterium]|nr:chromosomal replication initiator protein DnaA [Candidatus Tectomicrobia bacterium]